MIIADETLWILLIYAVLLYSVPVDIKQTNLSKAGFSEDFPLGIATISAITAL
jgi:hypothetical protein